MPTCHPKAGEPADRPCCRRGRLFIQQFNKLFIESLIEIDFIGERSLQLHPGKEKAIANVMKKIVIHFKLKTKLSD